MKSKEYSGYVRVRAEELNYSFKVWTESWSSSSCFCPTLVCRKLVKVFWTTLVFSRLLVCFCLSWCCFCPNLIKVWICRLLFGILYPECSKYFSAGSLRTYHMVLKRTIVLMLWLCTLCSSSAILVLLPLCLQAYICQRSTGCYSLQSLDLMFLLAAQVCTELCCRDTVKDC